MTNSAQWGRVGENHVYAVFDTNSHLTTKLWNLDFKRQRNFESFATNIGGALNWLFVLRSFSNKRVSASSDWLKTFLASKVHIQKTYSSKVKLKRTLPLHSERTPYIVQQPLVSVQDRVWLYFSSPPAPAHAQYKALVLPTQRICPSI